jgi:hypothetical protein
MVKKLYIDGCSFTYGLNLPQTSTLEHLFIESGYEVTNNSRPGKSNLAIAIDTYNNFQKFDTIVVGWTFASRFYIKYLDNHIDLLPTRYNIEINAGIDAAEIEESYKKLHKQIYSFFDVDYYNNLSDMLVFQTLNACLAHKKTIAFFSWEKRKVKKIYYPHISSNHYLECGHLNADGTFHLYEKLQGILTNDSSN